MLKRGRNRYTPLSKDKIDPMLYYGCVNTKH